MYLSPPQEHWAAEFAAESTHVSRALGGEIELYHIGSTAVKGLYAKDCIDMLGVVKHHALVRSKLRHLENLGYTHRGEYGIEGREYFSKTRRAVHLHVFEQGHGDIGRHLKFVEVMRTSPLLVEQLNLLKIQLHDQFPDDKAQYQQAKAHFYKQFNGIGDR